MHGLRKREKEPRLLQGVMLTPTFPSILLLGAIRPLGSATIERWWLCSGLIRAIAVGRYHVILSSYCDPANGFRQKRFLNGAGVSTAFGVQGSRQRFFVLCRIATVALSMLVLMQRCLLAACRRRHGGIPPPC